jgi:hypothetical protein
MYAVLAGPYRINSGLLRFGGAKVEFQLSLQQTCGSQGHGTSGYASPINYSVFRDAISFTNAVGGPTPVTEGLLSGNMITFRWTEEQRVSFVLRYARP